MAKILADKEIKKMLGTILIDADENYLNPNGIELRLGGQVRFHSTGEEMKLEKYKFLKVSPGETVSISSLEKIDFSPKAVNQIYPGASLMGIITPTTTMMREGISQVATKIDAGFRGILNWSLRNGSTKDLVIQYSEPIFKLTIFLLEKDEIPDMLYGERDDDKYQDTQGVMRSSRRIPADIPKNDIISSSFSRLDPKKQLREAGYPFDHIGTELVDLHGKFEIVSKDVVLLKEEFNRQTQQLSQKIADETGTLSNKLEDFRKRLMDHVEMVFDRKFYKIAGVIIGAISICYAGITFLQIRHVTPSIISFIAVVAGIAIIAIACLTPKGKKIEEDKH